MNIAQIHWAFPPVIGGVESHLAMLGPELIQKQLPGESFNRFRRL